MALGNEVLAAVLGEISARGTAAVTEEIQQAYLDWRLGQLNAVLTPAVTLTIQSWPAVRAEMAAGVSSTVVYPLRDQIAAKIAANDNEGLDVLLLAFYASAAAYLGG